MTGSQDQSGEISREEFARLFSAHARLFWCIAAGVLGDRGRASDVVQDSAAVGLTRLGQFRSGTSFTAWMGQIVRFTALNEARKHRVASVSDEVLSDIKPLGRAGVHHGGAGPSSPAGVDPFSGQLSPSQESFDDDTARALASLDETARACLLMKTVLDMPYARIGEALGIPEGTAMSHVHRSRAALRRSLAAAYGGARGGVA